MHLGSIVALDVESRNFPELQAGFFTNNNLNLWRIIQVSLGIHSLQKPNISILPNSANSNDLS